MNAKKADSDAMETAKAVMKRMLATPPAVHETKGKSKRKAARKGKARVR